MELNLATDQRYGSELTGKSNEVVRVFPQGNTQKNLSRIVLHFASTLSTARPQATSRCSRTCQSRCSNTVAARTSQVCRNFVGQHFRVGSCWKGVAPQGNNQKILSRNDNLHISSTLSTAQPQATSRCLRACQSRTLTSTDATSSKVCELSG